MTGLAMRCILILSISAFASHDLILVNYSNHTSRPELSALASAMIENFSIKFTPYGIRVSDRSEDPAGITLRSSLTQSLFSCEALETDTALLMRLTLVAGDDQRKISRNIQYNIPEPLDQNLTVMGVILLHTMEESVLSRVQVVSTPTTASLTLDDRIHNETPWEAYLSNGRHTLKLSLAGHVPLETSIAIAPGSNRFSFTLVPIKSSELWDNAIHRNESKQHYHYPIILTIAFALVGGISQSLYLKTDNKYDHIISSKMAEYDQLHASAEKYLMIRNISTVGCIISGIVLALKLKRSTKQVTR